jgi:hypothetical protein
MQYLYFIIIRYPEFKRKNLMLIRKLFLGIGASCLALILATTTQSAIAAPTAPTATAPIPTDDKDKLIEAITKRTELLESEVRALKHELKLVQANTVTATPVASDATSTEMFPTKKTVSVKTKTKKRAADQTTTISKNISTSASSNQHLIVNTQYIGSARHPFPPPARLEEVPT